MWFITIVAIVFVSVAVSCLIECFDTEEYEQRSACDHLPPCGGFDCRDNRI